MKKYGDSPFETSELRIEFIHKGKKHSGRVFVLDESVPDGEWPDWIQYAAAQLGHSFAQHMTELGGDHRE